MTNKSFFTVVLVLLAVHICLASIYASNQIFNQDQWRVLCDGLNLVMRDKLATTGAILPGVGPTIGSIPAILAGIPLLISNDPFAPMVFVIILRIIAFLILLITLRPFFSSKTLCWFATLFLLSPWVLYETVLSQQSFLLFGTSIVCGSLLIMRKYTIVKDEYANNLKVEKGTPLRHFFYTFCLMIGIGVSLQISYVSVAFIFLTVLLYLRRLIIFSWLGCLAGILVIAGSLTPFIDEISANPELSSQFFNDDKYHVGFGITYVYPFLKTIVDWLRLGSTIFSRYLVIGFDPGIFTTEPMKTVFYYVWLVIVYAVGSVTFLFNFGANVIILHQVKGKIFSLQHIYEKNNFLVLLCCFSFISVMLTSALLPVSFPTLTLSVFLPFALLPVLLIIERHQGLKVRNHMVLLVGMAVFLIAVNICGATSSDHFDSSITYYSQLEED